MAEQYQCRACGGTVIPASDGKTGICEYCGKKIVFPRKGYKLMNQANALRARMEFEQAEALYQSLALLNSDDPEVWWSILLCRYGILYVQEADRRVPTVNRMKYDSVFDQEAYKKAIALADEAQRRIYEEEARTIQDIQDRLIVAVEKEEKYDIFISFKDKDADGKRTRDSALAQDIYEALADEGYRVFFSRITLRTAIGEEFEPKIFSALHSARIMILVATTVEHIEADWVKNEWSRYLKLMEQDAGKYLIPVYTIGVKPEQLPVALSRLEGIQANGEAYLQLIKQNVETRLGRRTVPRAQAVAPETIRAQAEELQRQNVELLIQEGIGNLKEKMYQLADKCFEKALDIDVDCAKAWWGRLLAGTCCFWTEEDFHQDEQLEHYYQKAMHLATTEEQQQFAASLDQYERNKKEVRYRRIYGELQNVTSWGIKVFARDEKSYKKVEQLEKECLACVPETEKEKLKKELEKYHQKRERVICLKREVSQIEEEKAKREEAVEKIEQRIREIKSDLNWKEDEIPSKYLWILSLMLVLNGIGSLTPGLFGITLFGFAIEGTFYLLAGGWLFLKLFKKWWKHEKQYGRRAKKAKKQLLQELDANLQTAKKELEHYLAEQPGRYAQLEQNYSDIKGHIYKDL